MRGVDENREFGRKAMLRKLQRQIALEIGAGQEGQEDLPAHAAPLELQLHVQERVLTEQQVRRAVGEYQQQSHRRALAANISQQIHGRRIGPVQIVQEQHQRLEARHLLKEGGQLAFEALLRGHLGILPHARKRGVVRHQRRELHVPGRGHDLHHLCDRVAARAVEQAVERFQKRQIGFAAGQALRAPPAGDAARPFPHRQLAEELFHQGGLAHARLAGHAEQEPTAGRG